MLSLNSIQSGTTEFDDGILDDTIIEINILIKENATTYRLLIEFQAETVEDKIYKNGIIHYYLIRGYKVVAYPTFIYIDWGRVNVYQEIKPFVRPINQLGNHFTGVDLYLALTNNKDMRKISFRSLQYVVDREVKAMNLSGRSTGIISFDISTIMTVASLNNMFAPDLALYSSKHPDTHLTFVEGGNLKISLGEPPELYTDIPLEVLFGVKNI